MQTKKARTLRSRLLKTGDLRYRVLENFIKYGYNSPVIVIDGINFGGKGTHMIGNEYILSQGETISSVKNKILDIEMKSFMNSLPSARRIYDNNIVLFWNPNTEKGVYVIQPAKNTFSSTGISSNQMSDIGKDGASAQINTAFLEAGRGIREISKISDVEVTFVAPPVNKNPVSTLITIIKRIATRNKFKNFGTSNKHKMISDFSYLFSIVEGINTKLMNELNNAGNKEEAKTIIESFIDNQLNTDQSWLNDLMEDSARSFYSARRFAELIDQNYKTQTILLIRSLLGNKIIKDTSGNGFKIGLEEELNMLFLKKDGSNNPIPLTYEDLPSAFTIKNGEKVMLTKNLYNEFKSENKPLMVVHDSNGEIGIVAAQIFTDLRLKNGEVITEGYKHNDVGEFAGAVFHNVYLCDANFNKLVSRVEIKSGSEQHIVRQSGWEIGFIEVALAGDIMQLYASEYYMAFGITSGDQHFCFLQKTIAKMNPYDHQEKILPDISFKARYKDKAVKFLEQSEDISQEDENNLLLVANFLYQIGNRYQKDNDDLAIADLFLQINEKSHKLFDGTIMTYSRDSYRQILTALDPSTQLKDMTLFQIDSEGNVQYDSPDIKTFFKTWLQFIKNDLNKPSEQSSHLFDKFSHLADSVYSFTDDPKLQLIEDVANPGTYLQNDLMVLRLTREALKEAFGSIGYTLLTTGLMTFTQSATGSYEVHFKNHDNRILGQMFNKFNLRGLYSSKYNVYSSNYFASTSKKLAHAMTVSTFVSFLFNGYTQNYEYDLVQDTLKTPSSVWNNILPTNSFFAKLFTNYPRYYQTPGFYEYARNSFYNTYLNNYLVREKARYYGTHDQTLSGRQVLVSEIGSLFEGDSTLDEVLADYLEEDFRYRVYKLSRFRPSHGQVVNRDYISLIREVLKGTTVKLRFGDQNAINPFFKISGEDPNSGYFLNLDSNTLSSDVLQQIMMTLEYYAANNRKMEQFKNEVARIENIWHQIKGPIKETYDKLYDYLWNFKDEQGNPANQFSVSFHKTTYDGIDSENSLLLNSVPHNVRGSDLTGEKIDILIDRSNPLEFRKAILSCIKYMVKYNSFSIVKVGNSESFIHALYLSLDKFLTNKYIATSFTGNSIQGDLTPFANNLYLTEKEEYDNIWDADKLFPIYAFKDAENFDQWLIEYFASLSATYQTSDDRYSSIKELMDLN